VYREVASKQTDARAKSSKETRTLDGENTTAFWPRYYPRNRIGTLAYKE